MDLLSEFAIFAERVRAIAKTGLAFKPDGYDSSRYLELLQAAADIETRIVGADSSHAEQLVRTWRDSISPERDGYVTAALGCGGIVFNRDDELLMMKRSDGGWLYPAGWCDVGYTPAQTIAKEVHEETGLTVRPVALMAAMDSRFMGLPGRHFITLFFYCELLGGDLRPDPVEALDAGFFNLDKLPQPLHMPQTAWVELARQFHFKRRQSAFFESDHLA